MPEFRTLGKRKTNFFLFTGISITIFCFYTIFKLSLEKINSSKKINNSILFGANITRRTKIKLLDLEY